MEVVIRYSKAKYVFFVFVCVFMCLQFNGEAKTQEWRRRARQQRWRPATCRRCQPFVLKSIHCVFLIIIIVIITITNFKESGKGLLGLKKITCVFAKYSLKG